jgi:hypothetical protein
VSKRTYPTSCWIGSGCHTRTGRAQGGITGRDTLGWSGMEVGVRVEVDEVNTTRTYLHLMRTFFPRRSLQVISIIVDPRSLTPSPVNCKSPACNQPPRCTLHFLDRVSHVVKIRLRTHRIPWHSHAHTRDSHTKFAEIIRGV